MDEWIELLAVLESMIDRLLEIATDKRGIVVRGDIAQLDTLVREETGLLARISAIEDKRQRSAVIFALRAGADPKGITLLKILEKLPASEKKDRLVGLRDRLNDKMDELSRLNGINEELLTTQRDIARFMLEGATRPIQLGTRYADDGRDADDDNRLSLIDKNV